MTVFDLHHLDNFCFEGDTVEETGHIIFDRLSYLVNVEGELRPVLWGIVIRPDGKAFNWCCPVWMLPTVNVVSL